MGLYFVLVNISVT